MQIALDRIQHVINTRHLLVTADDCPQLAFTWLCFSASCLFPSLPDIIYLLTCQRLFASPQDQFFPHLACTADPYVTQIYPGP